MKAVILASGKGTRLLPYTRVLPKPLLPVGETPMLAILIRQLAYYGFNEQIITVHHLGDLIELFVERFQRCLPGTRLKTVRQHKLMGTVGGVSALPGLDEPFLVVNADLLTTINYADFLEYHRQCGGLLTVGIHPHRTRLAFGVLDVQADGQILGYREKPEVEYPISMGIYGCDPALLAYIPPDDYLDAPDLVNRLVADRQKVVGYKSDAYWLDMGRPDDFTRAQEEFEAHRAEFLPEGA
jgi:NDP-sugar pyrophosphorylase family protein